MPESENERQYRVITQMISMYSSLRDRYERRDFWLNTLLIVVSIVLNAFVFASDDAFKSLSLPVTASKICIQIVSVIVLIFSIIQLKVDWPSRAKSYGDAGERLNLLKAKYRESYDKVKDGDCTAVQQLHQEYSRAMEGLPRIPEKYFAGLKAEHQFKMCISQRISENPKAPAWLLRIILRIEGVKNLLRKNNGTNRPIPDTKPDQAGRDLP